MQALYDNIVESPHAGRSVSTPLHAYVMKTIGKGATGPQGQMQITWRITMGSIITLSRVLQRVRGIR